MRRLQKARAEAARGRRAVLRFETFEDRIVPAITFQFDYSLDSSGFFSDPARRAALERAGAELASRITSTPSAIAPGGSNAWQAVFNHPVTRDEVRLNNLSLPAGTILVFAGARDLFGSEAGEGGPGGYWVSGSRAFQEVVTTRGMPSFGPWGGSLTLDTNKSWYFGADPNALPAGQLDFQSVATHELGHLLGFGTASQWDSLIANGRFIGANVATTLGTNPFVSADQSHFAQDTYSPGCSCPSCAATVAAAAAGRNPVSMQPTVALNMRVGYSELDYAALADLGWQVSGVNDSPQPVPPPTSPVSPPPTGLETGTRIVGTSGPLDGSVQLYTSQSNGQLTSHGGPFQPLGNFGGAVRSTVADVNGDGTSDLIFGTGPGGGSRIRVLDGRTMTDLVVEFWAFEPSFDGGVFLAAADFDRDGRAEIVVTPDQGGGSRVRVFGVSSGQSQVKADFFGIDDPSFRGGARAAAGDLNGDGTADLVVAAGFGGGPRVSVIDGNTVLTARRVGVVPDFFAFEAALRNGAYVAVGDVDGDGRGDLTFGAGPGGAPRVMTISGHTLTTAGVDAALAAPIANVFAGNTDDRDGVRVASRDLDGSVDEVVTGNGSNNEVRVYSYSGGLTASGSFSPFGPGPLDGVYVG